MNKLKNAKIESTMLGVEDHGVFTFMLNLDYGDSSHQGCGGYSLGYSHRDRKIEIGHLSSVPLLREILRVVEVEMWEELKGKLVRAVMEDEGFSARTIGIQNIVNDKRIIFKEFVESYDNFTISEKL